MERDYYAIEVIKSSLDQLAPEPIWGQRPIYGYRPPPYKSEILRPFLPYLLHSIKEWDGDWIVLNRDYKPLGLSEGSWIDYPDYESLRIPRELTVFDEKLFSVNPLDVDQECYFFYCDRTAPRTKPLILEYILRVRRCFNI